MDNTMDMVSGIFFSMIIVGAIFYLVFKDKDDV